MAGFLDIIAQDYTNKSGVPNLGGLLRGFTKRGRADIDRQQNLQVQQQQADTANAQVQRLLAEGIQSFLQRNQEAGAAPLRSQMATANLDERMVDPRVQSAELANKIQEFTLGQNQRESPYRMSALQDEQAQRRVQMAQQPQEFNQRMAIGNTQLGGLQQQQAQNEAMFPLERQETEARVGQIGANTDYTRANTALANDSLANADVERLAKMSNLFALLADPFVQESPFMKSVVQRLNDTGFMGQSGGAELGSAGPSEDEQLANIVQRQQVMGQLNEDADKARRKLSVVEGMGKAQQSMGERTMPSRANPEFMKMLQEFLFGPTTRTTAGRSAEGFQALY